MIHEHSQLSYASISINIPDRTVISDVSLKPVSTENPRLYHLEVRDGEAFDFSDVKLADVSLPRGPWPSIQILKANEDGRLPQGTSSSESSFVADRTRVQFMVQVEGEQRIPAKVVISNVKKDGVGVEAVAHASLPPPAWAQSMSPESEKYVDVAGIMTRYFERGSGESMLLIHGGQAGSAGFAAWSWMPNFDALSNNFRVIALDRIGQGYTDNPKNDESYENYYQTVVDHVWGFIEKLNLKNIHLVGHSQGGWPATRIALDHPDIIKSLTIVDSATAAPADREGGSVNFYGFLSRFIHPPEGETAESILRELNMYSYTGNNITESQIARLLELARLPKMEEARLQMVRTRMKSRPSQLSQTKSDATQRHRKRQATSIHTHCLGTRRP